MSKEAMKMTQMMDALIQKYSDKLYDGTGAKAANDFELDVAAIRLTLTEQPAPVQVPFLVRLYNEGYHAGHHHTVEGYYTHVVPQELDTYHSDLVAEWLADNPQAQPAPAAQEPVGCEWTPCMKLPVVVHVRKQRLGEAHVSTREGITPVHPDDLIMRGVSGEEYPIGRAIFLQTYTLDTTPQAQRKPLTDEEIDELSRTMVKGSKSVNWLCRAIEAAHGIKEKNT